jgi:hypothetical protein
MNFRAIGLLTLVFFALTTGDAHAYIDPGTGSVVTTAILGFFAAIAYTCRKWFYRIVDLVRRRPKADKKG